MSFLGGPECSTASNPLSKLQKHVQDDRTLQRDRLINGGPTGTLGGFRSTGAGPAQDEALNAFLSQPPGLQQDINLASGHLRIDSPQVGQHLRASSASPAWANDFHAGQSPIESMYTTPPLGATQFGPNDVAHFRRMSPTTSSRSSPLPYTDAHQRPMLGVAVPNHPSMGYGLMNRSIHQQPMYDPRQQLQQPQAVESKGKGKLVDLDDHRWEEQFAQLELHDQQQSKEEDEANAVTLDLDQTDKSMQSETNHVGDFESIWRGIQAEAAASKAPDENQVEQWSSDIGDFSDLGRFSDPVVENYIFEEDNLFLDAKDAFEQGERIVREGGNLSLAALAFEAAIQQNQDHLEAWVYLGSVQAQNEKETAAIRAHEQASRLDPKNLAALMGLAVSYTNEGYESKAYRSLERWLAAKYPQVLDASSAQSATDLGGFVDRAALHDRVTQNFIRAAQLSPGGEQMDPDVQVGLGVLFYGAEQFDKAVDCFQAALDSFHMGTTNQREQVHLLWNRLGATLANSGRPEEAVSAYQQALSLHPNFVRARYNLGVSCINMNCPEEAASHFLAALDMHKAIEKSGRSKAYELLGGGSGDGGGRSPSSTGGGNPALDAQLDRMTSQNMSVTLYETLRRVFSQMGRHDLANRTVVGVDPEVFRPEFDF